MTSPRTRALMTGFGTAPRRLVASASPGAAPLALIAGSIVLLCGCYEHVTKSSIGTRESQKQFQPNVDEQGPSILNELMWGPPPKGEDPVKYYRRMNSLGIQQ